MWTLDISAETSGSGRRSDDCETRRRFKVLTLRWSKKEGEEVAVRQLPRQFGGSTLPEECSSNHNGFVVDLLPDLVFGHCSDVLSLQLYPIREVVAGEPDPGLVVLNQASEINGVDGTVVAIVDLELIASTGCVQGAHTPAGTHGERVG